MNYELLKELTQAWGVSGREKAVREIIRREAAPYADELWVDALGSLIVRKKGTGAGKKIMLAAHMDEIGMQVKKILPDGRLKLCRVGWVWTSALYNDTIIFRNGTVGVVGCDGNIEEAKNDIGKLFVDIGCTTKEDAEKYVQIGDYCGFIGNYYELCNGLICSKSLDNRAGCFLLLEALQHHPENCVNDVYYVFSVQEEVGCRGAQAAAAAIAPDIGISVDVTPDHFYPSDLEGCNEVGKGVGVSVGNPSAMLDEYLVDKMLELCEKEKIPYQRDVMDRGGTDASSINLSNTGVRVCGISIVDRFAHSQSSIVSKKDLEAADALLRNYIAEEFVFEE